MNSNEFAATISTLGPVGYFGASGTIASVLTLPLVYMLHQYLPNPWHYLTVIIILAAISLALVHGALVHLRNKKDPSEVVIDEVIGCLLTFWGVALTNQSILVVFLAFRGFDIIKLGLVRYAEYLPGAWGIIADDLVAALLANIIVRLLF